MAQAIPLRTALSARLRELRRELGITQEELAVWVNAHCHLGWTRDTVRNTEEGTREIPLAEFFSLAALLPLTLEELFPAEVVLELDGGLKVQGGAGLRALLGPRKDATVTPQPVRLEVGFPQARVATDKLGISDSVEVVHLKGDAASASSSSGQLTVEVGITASAEVIRLADQKAATSLGIAPAKVRELSNRLWGRDLTTERDTRVAERLGDKEVSPRSLQALRGHVTRELLDELRPHLKRKSRNKARNKT